MPNITTPFVGADGATLANFNLKIADMNTHGNDTTVHTTQLFCTKSATVYALAGTLATSGLMPCVFIAPSAYVTGDTFIINGTVYTISILTGVALTSGAFMAGAVVQMTLDVTNKKINILPSNINYSHVDRQVIFASSNMQLTSAQLGTIVEINAPSSITVTLPNDLISDKSYQYDIVNGTGYNQIISAGSHSFFGTVDSGNTYVLKAGQSITVLCDGTNWFLSSNVLSKKIVPSLTNGWTEAAAGYYAFSVRREGNMANINALLTGGTMSAGNSILIVPPDYVPSVRTPIVIYVMDGSSVWRTAAAEISADGVLTHPAALESNYRLYICAAYSI